MGDVCFPVSIVIKFIVSILNKTEEKKLTRDTSPVMGVVASLLCGTTADLLSLGSMILACHLPTIIPKDDTRALAKELRKKVQCVKSYWPGNRL